MKEIKTLEQRQAFELGVTYLKSYLIFCGAHPDNEKFATYEFINGIKNFALGLEYIPNSTGLSFEQFCPKYSIEDLKKQMLVK